MIILLEDFSLLDTAYSYKSFPLLGYANHPSCYARKIEWSTGVWIYFYREHICRFMLRRCDCAYASDSFYAFVDWNTYAFLNCFCNNNGPIEPIVCVRVRVCVYTDVLRNIKTFFCFFFHLIERLFIPNPYAQWPRMRLAISSFRHCLAASVMKRFHQSLSFASNQSGTDL